MPTSRSSCANIRSGDAIASRGCSPTKAICVTGQAPRIRDAAIARQPVTQVSWFAASAYCEARGARLPRWYEWEFAAAASATRPDARDDPAWRQQILDWYSKSARGALPVVGASPANYFGIRDLHGVVWEWVEDAGSMLVSDDSREQGDPNRNRFCGTGALEFRAEGQLRHDDAHRDAVEHEGGLQLELDGISLCA